MFILILVLKLKEYSVSKILQIIVQKRLIMVNPNPEIVLRIHLCISSTNASGEHSFSVLKRVTNYLRNLIATK